jgi:hypothetical protein
MSYRISRFGEVPFGRGLVDTRYQNIGTDSGDHSDNRQPSEGRVGVHFGFLFLLDLTIFVGSSSLCVRLEERGVGLEL